MLASDKNDLKLTTQTLEVTTIQDHDTGTSIAGQVGVTTPGTPGKAPGVTVSGDYATHTKEGESIGTIGGGKIVVKDQATSTPVDQINRDTNNTQVITKDESAGTKVYISDSSVRAAVQAVDTIGKTISQISTGVFSELGKQGNESFQKLAQAKEKGSLTDADIIQQLDSCNGHQGFNLLELFVTTAYASGTCMVKTPDGKSIPFSGEDRQKCMDAYIALANTDPTGFQKILIESQLLGLIGVSPTLAGLGVVNAMSNGPVAIATDESGKSAYLQNENGELLYRNPVTGKHFWADRNNPTNIKVIEAAADLALVFAGGSVASSVVSPNGAKAKVSAKHLPDIFDMIKPTQEVYSGSLVPKSFELSIDSHTKIWVHGNATEHLAEYAAGLARTNKSPEFVNLATQIQLKSLQNAVDAATLHGVPYDKLVTVGGWELKFSPPREGQKLPALIHALQK